MALDIEDILFKMRHEWTGHTPLFDDISTSIDAHIVRRIDDEGLVSTVVATRDQIINNILAPCIQNLMAVPAYCKTRTSLKLLADATLLLERYNDLSANAAVHYGIDPTKKLIKVRWQADLPRPVDIAWYGVISTPVENIFEPPEKEGVAPPSWLPPRIEPTKEAMELIRSLIKYIDRVEGASVKKDQSIFEAGFFHHATSRGLNRKANYELAKNLELRLIRGESIVSVFASKDALLAKRLELIREKGIDQEKGFVNRDINSSELNDVIKKGLKLSNNQKEPVRTLRL